MMKLTGDSLTLFLLCSHLGLSDEPAAKPLTAREWNDLQSKLEAASIQASSLPGLSAEQLRSSLELEIEKATRRADAVRTPRGA